MTLDSFYQVLSGICFVMTGLWWSVVEGRKDWLRNPTMRNLAGGVYASFLIPGVMALGAQIGGENKLVWRTVFAIAAILGIFFTTRLLAFTLRTKQAGAMARNRWVVIILYILVLVFGVFPELAAPTGLTPIQVEAFIISIIVLTGHALAWVMMTHNPE
jgi:hypothetical protein